MSRRNPMNDRYQQMEEKPHGKTRKSAASAQPKKKAAASVRTKTRKEVSKEKAAAQKKAEQTAKRLLYKKYNKVKTPRYKKLKAIWIACIVVSCLAVVAFVGSIYYELPERVGTVAVTIAGIGLGATIFVDFVLMRKERDRYQTQMAKEDKKQEKKRRKAQGKKK